MSDYTLPEGCSPVLLELVKVFDQRYADGSGQSDSSVTTVIDSPRRRILLAKHKGETVRSVVDEFFRVRGSIAHTAAELLPDVPGKRYKEVRLYITVGGWVIGGQSDLIDCVLQPAWALRDFKYTYPATFRDGVKLAWVAQANIYRYMAEQHYNIDIDEQYVSAIFGDWRSYKAKAGEMPWVDYPVERWSDERVLAYLEERVKLHREAEEVLPFCTDEERWREPDNWVVRNRDTLRTRLKFPTKREAHVAYDAMSDATAKKNEVVLRKGKCKRCCIEFCSVSPFCTQLQNELNPVAGMTGVKGA